MAVFFFPLLFSTEDTILCVMAPFSASLSLVMGVKILLNSIRLHLCSLIDVCSCFPASLNASTSSLEETSFDPVPANLSRLFPPTFIATYLQ